MSQYLLADEVVQPFAALSGSVGSCLDVCIISVSSCKVVVEVFLTKSVVNFSENCTLL
jgi:hypothetical protein